MLKLRKIIIFLLFFLVLTGGQLHAQNAMSTHNEIYVFHYDLSDSILIKNLIDKIDPGIKDLEKFFGQKSWIDIQIYLAKSEEEFQLYSINGFPEWAQAIAFVNKRMIIIRAESADEIQRLPQVLLHELVHIYLGFILPDKRIPTWLHEGLAQRLSHESLTMDEQVFIANALYSNRISYLADLDSMFAFSPLKARLGYALARSAVDYFVREYSLEVLMNTLQALNDEPLDRAFLKTTGKDFVDFETGWFSYIDEKYSWMFLLNAENIVWAILILLFFAALIKLRYKNRKTIDSWESDLDIQDLN